MRWYPDGEHSFHDRGCGLGGGAAHCDFSELEICFGVDYTRRIAPDLKGPPLEMIRKRIPDYHLPFHPSHFAFGVSHLKYVTLLRDPVERVVSEFFWGCGAKVNKRFTGEHEGKVLFDWPRRVSTAPK